MKPKIEKNIPIPKLIRNGKNINILRQMEIGDSFVFEGKSRSLFLVPARRIGIKLTTRKIGHDKFRLWRIK